MLLSENYFIKIFFLKFDYNHLLILHFVDKFHVIEKFFSFLSNEKKKLMQNFKPEGQTNLTPSNQAALSSPNSLHEACIVGDTLEARALLCDKEHNLRVDLGCMYGIIHVQNYRFSKGR